MMKTITLMIAVLALLCIPVVADAARRSAPPRKSAPVRVAPRSKCSGSSSGNNNNRLFRGRWFPGKYLFGGW